MDENRSLLAVQRHQSRKIQVRESIKADWPKRLSSLENEVRIYREKLRKIRQRDLKFAETRKWQGKQGPPYLPRRNFTPLTHCFPRSSFFFCGFVSVLSVVSVASFFFAKIKTSFN